VGPARQHVSRRFAAVAAVVGGLVLAACGTSSTSSNSTDSVAPNETSRVDGGASVDGSVSGHLHSGDLNLEPATVMGRPDRVIAGPQGNDGQFIVECELSHIASDDPILYPGRAGASHLHAFFGNVETSATSELSDLLEADTTCDDSRDTAAYWVPVLVDEAAVIEPVYAVAYYRAGLEIDPTSVESYPPGLTMIAGDPLAVNEQPIEVVAWGCGSGARRTPMPPVCPTGSELSLWVTFPDCWDGKNIDVPGHRGHLRYSTGGECPRTHPEAIPQLFISVFYPVNGDVSHLRLSSGTLGTGHADFINAWDQDHLDHEVDLCIRQQNVCGISSGRRPA
jgi:hypothetical protein